MKESLCILFVKGIVEEFLNCGDKSLDHIYSYSYIKYILSIAARVRLLINNSLMYSRMARLPWR